MRNLALTSIVRWLGILILLLGAQFWAFHRSASVQERDARLYLQQLQHEVLDNRFRDAALTDLDTYEKGARLEGPAVQSVQRMAALLRSLPANAAESVLELDRIAADLKAASPDEQIALTAVRERVAALKNIYSDNYASLRDQVASPAWYFLPAALLSPGRSHAVQALQMNHALYRMLIGERSDANAVLAKLSEDKPADELLARLRFLQSRLNYDSFRAESSPEYLRNSIDYARDSVASDSDYTLGKSFLDFLLALHTQKGAAQISPVMQQGTGEGEGKQGSMMPEMRDF